MSIPDGARIGPNAITRVAESLRSLHGDARTAEIFATAGLAHYLEQAPGDMVEEGEVTRLQQALRQMLGLQQAAAVSRDAGLRTGDYLLAHRIPRAAQWLLKSLPAAVASPVLLRAISGHSWTFAGSGRFAIEHGRPLVLSIAGCAICRGARGPAPVCDYYAATFERLYRALVSPRSTVREIACQATGEPACRFEIRW